VALGIRRASLPQDRGEMIEVLNRNFGTSQERRFDWRHTLNPAGEAWSWFLYDTGTLSTVAMATVFPRHMRVNGEDIRGGQVGEFAVDANYRSLGPAVKLQRTTFQPVDSGAISFCYDCPPHDEGMSTFVRIGMRPNCEVHRYALLLRSEEYLGKRIGDGLWTKPAVAAANLMLRARPLRRVSVSAEITEHSGKFGEEFSQLDKTVLIDGTIRGSRDAKDLNWRYREDPMASVSMPQGTVGKYRVLVARRAGELQAFLIFFIQSDGIAILVDLFGRNLGERGLALMQASVDICRREHVSAFHAFSSETNELTPLLRQAGFSRRERNARVVAYSTREDTRFAQKIERCRWAFSQLEVML